MHGSSFGHPVDEMFCANSTSFICLNQMLKLKAVYLYFCMKNVRNLAKLFSCRNFFQSVRTVSLEFV